MCAAAHMGQRSSLASVASHIARLQEARGPVPYVDRRDALRFIAREVWACIAAEGSRPAEVRLYTATLASADAESEFQFALARWADLVRSLELERQPARPMSVR